jgi:integrase
MSVYRRKNKDGSFTWWVTKTINGVRHRKRIPTARTQRQAEEAERQFLVDLHQGKVGKAQGSITFKEFVERTYLKWAKDNKRSWKTDEYRITPLLEFFGNRRLCDISPFLVEGYKVKRLKTPIKFKTMTRKRSVAVVNRELCLLSAIFRVAIKSKQASTNPCHEVELLKGEKSRKRFLTPDEEKRLMKVLTEPRTHLKDMVKLAIHAGLRERELLTLTLDDVDLFKMELNLRQTKNGEGRDVPLNNTASEVVLRLVERAKAEGSKYLFTNPETGKCYMWIDTAWKTACRLAEIHNLRFHDLRHTFGTRAIENGATLAEVKEVMGHKSISTTEKYTHATEAGKRRAVEAVEKSGHITVTRLDEEKRAKAVNG